MSGSGKFTGKSMIARWTDVERRKSGDDGHISKLTREKTSLLKERLLAEKDGILAEFRKSSEVHAIRKSSRLKTWLPLGIAALFLLGIGFPFFRQQYPLVETRLVFQQGSFADNHETLQTNSVIPIGVPFSTKQSSVAVLSHGEQMRTLLGQNSQLTIQRSQIEDQKPSLVMSHRNGLIFCAVKKGKAYLKIQTRQAEISVIGTSFSVQADDKNTQLLVLEGIVQIIPSESFTKRTGNGTSTENSDRRILIQKGEKVQLSQKNNRMTLTLLSPAEIQFLRMLNDLTDQAGNRTRADFSGKSLSALADELVISQNKRKEQALTSKLTLAEIRRKYGKISKVNLINGKSYVGFFRIQGNQVLIVTPNGTIRVTRDLLRDVRDAE